MGRSGEPEREILPVDSGGFHRYKFIYIGGFRDPRKYCKLLKINGRGERIRTSDPLVPNQVLYQAEPLPEHEGKSRTSCRCGLVNIGSQRALGLVYQKAHFLCPVPASR
jgi:hypothetical protein